MYNPDEFIENRFLNLAKSLQYYHKAFKGQNSLSHKPDLMNKVREVYEEYSDIADIRFTFRDIECFSRKVTNTINFLSPVSTGENKGVASGDDLFYLTQDLQLLLYLCIMGKVGFKKEDIAKIYSVHELWRWAYENTKSHSTPGPCEKA